jgi:hypothetical protein
MDGNYSKLPYSFTGVEVLLLLEIGCHKYRFSSVEKIIIVFWVIKSEKKHPQLKKTPPTEMRIRRPDSVTVKLKDPRKNWHVNY